MYHTIHHQINVEEKIMKPIKSIKSIKSCTKIWDCVACSATIRGELKAMRHGKMHIEHLSSGMMSLMDGTGNYKCLTCMSIVNMADIKHHLQRCGNVRQSWISINVRCNNNSCKNNKTTDSSIDEYEFTKLTINMCITLYCY